MGQITKEFVRHFVADIYYFSGIHRILRKGNIAILMYHRVLSKKELAKYYVQPGMYVHVDIFEKQMRFLKKKFIILSLMELIELWKYRRISEDEHYCVLTFDDGWLDNYTYAYPILKRYEIPATIFLPTAYIGTNSWFWPDLVGHILRLFCLKHFPIKNMEEIQLTLRKYSIDPNSDGKLYHDRIDSTIESLKRFPENVIYDFINRMLELLCVEAPDERIVLNWDEIREMSRYDISFGAHSVNHRILTGLSHENIEKEIKDPLSTFTREMVNFIPVFCYPNGAHSPEIIEQLKSSGYKAAVTTKLGLENKELQNPYLLRRVGIHNDITYSVPLLSLRMSGLNGFV